jgi:hypothetical protein
MEGQCKRREERKLGGREPWFISPSDPAVSEVSAPWQYVRGNG